MALDIHGFEGKRIDIFLRKKFVGAKLSFIFSLFRKGLVLVNGFKVRNNYRLKAGDKVDVKIDEHKLKSFNKISRHFRILFEDKFYLIVDKPAGLPVHGGWKIKWSLVDEVRDYLGIDRSDFLANRLDRGTSGIVIIAKDKEALGLIGKMIEKRWVDKYYTALVNGKLQKKKGRLVSMLEIVKGRAVESAKGKLAETEYKVAEEFNKYSLIELKLITGRTHQIRAQLANAGCPIIGDWIYGAKENEFGLKRQFLHAFKIRFKHPLTGKIVEIKDKMPDDLRKIIDKLKKNSKKN